MVLQRHDEHVLHVGFDGTGCCPRNPHSLYRGSIFMPPDTGKHFAHAVRPVQVFAQFHKVAARRCAKVIPFVEPVVDLERRSAFIAQR